MKGYEISKGGFVEFYTQEELKQDYEKLIKMYEVEIKEIDLLQCDCGRLFPENSCSSYCARCEKIRHDCMNDYNDEQYED